MRHERIRYYSSFTDDFEQSAAQDFTLPSDYRWVREDIGSRLLSALIYTLAAVFSSVYCRLVLHMRIRGARRLRRQRGGCFIYGNHTQPFGDVFIPALCALPKRIYTVVSTANYGIPVIGSILPYLGALPIVDSVHGIKELHRAMAHRLEQGHPIAIYPEAHVWEYYTGIRPFPDAVCKYPIRFGVPSYAMTVTYQRSRLFRRPWMTVYIDGPFTGVGDTPRERAADLHARIRSVMQARSAYSDCDYIRYVPQEKE